MISKQQLYIEHATEGNVKKLEELIKEGVDIDGVAASGFPALHYASRIFPHNLKKDTLGCTKVLVEAGAKPFAIYAGGESPFATAVIEGQFKTVEYFFTLGEPDLNLRLDAGTSLLDEIAIKLKNKPLNVSDPAIAKAVDAEENQYLEIAELLIEKGIDVKSKNKNDQGALHTASGVGVTPMVELLIKNGADVNHKDSQGLTCLHYASRGGFISTMQALVKAGADVNAQDGWGFTPAHEAVMSKSATSLEVLAEHKANFSLGLTKAYDAKNPVGFSPQDMAEANKQDDLIAIIKSVSAPTAIKEEQPVPQLEFNEIPFKGWEWDRTKHMHHGVDINKDDILWYTQYESRQGGGASHQTLSDYIHSGSNSIKPPEEIDKEIREYILKFKK
ncbi:ankyrin repeat domain-containing protein [Candidatus Uhrbacteria bacterium]|nr:ankyrin repeat domain-containing protein [Candidatus Uhrbacteria bacterium]